MANCGTLVVESQSGDGGDGGTGGGGGDQPSQPGEAPFGLGSLTQWARQNPRLAAGIGLVGGLAAFSVARGDTRQPTLPAPRRIRRRIQ